MELAGMKVKQLKRRVQEKFADPQCGDDLFLIGYVMYLDKDNPGPLHADLADLYRD